LLGREEDQGPIAEACIPKGIPATHWWWRYPNAFKRS
jgi:hypothetical protein